MNENIDLTKILKDCPTGFKLYSSVYGEVKFVGIYENHNHLWIDIKVKNNIYVSLTLEGKFSYNYDGECVLFTSKDQRDWSKFTAPWLKKEKFDPKTLQPFDKVLVRIFKTAKWRCEHFSYFTEGYAFSDNGGKTYWTNRESRKTITFPCDSKQLETEYIILKKE